MTGPLTEQAQRLIEAIERFFPEGFRYEDGVWHDTRKDAQGIVTALAASLVSAQEALRQIEWIHGHGTFYCPKCGQSKTRGHDPSCPVGAVLAGTAERQEPEPVAKSRPEFLLLDDHGNVMGEPRRAFASKNGWCVSLPSSVLRSGMAGVAFRAGSAEPPAKPEEETT